MSKLFIAIVGPSGSGKTTIAEILEEEFGLMQIQSYTNRPKRYDGEKGHIFIDERDVSKIKEKYTDIVADDIFDGNYYFSTQSQIEECDIYVVSPDAVPMLKQNYNGDKVIKVLYVKAPSCLRRLRMIRRGDSKESAKQRIDHDARVFKYAELLADSVVVNIVRSETRQSVIDIVNKWRNEVGKKSKSKSRHR